MKLTRLYFLLKLFVLFLVLLVAQYFLSGIYFRLVKDSDLTLVDWISVFSGSGLCYLIFRKLILAALKERISILVIAAFFLVFSVSLGFFLRFSLQMANGLLDFSQPEARVILVSSKKITPFGGSITEGINPMAHMIYFHDLDDSGGNCELLVDDFFFYAVDPGSSVELTVRKGFFHWPWVEDYRQVKAQLNWGQTHMPEGHTRAEFEKK